MVEFGTEVVAAAGYEGVAEVGVVSKLLGEGPVKGFSNKAPWRVILIILLYNIT